MARGPVSTAYDTSMLCPALVGRTDELRVLRARVGQVADGRGGVVALVGDAGVGKSRLLTEIEAAAAALELPVLSGRAVPGGGSVPYRPLTEAFLAASRTMALPRDPSLDGFGVHLARLVPGWGQGGPAIDDASPLLVGEALVRVLRLLGKPPGGALLLVEDVHWADAETLAVLDYLADALPRERVVCVCASRPGGAASDLIARLARRDPSAVIAITALGETDVEAMVAACLGTQSAPSGLAGFVRAHSDGSPFLVEELLAGLVASGDLRLDGDHWVVGELRATVPASLQDSIRRRLVVLDPATRRVLGAAALLGRRFDWELLPGVAGVDGRAAADCLRAAVDEQLIEADGDGFTFRHALTREAVLADLLPPDRRELARRAWPALERANPGLPGATCELAAELAEAAGDPVAATGRLVESARRALGGGALASAESTARRARRVAADHHEALLDADEVLVNVLVAAGKADEALSLGRDLAARMSLGGVPSPRSTALHVTLARAAVTAGELAAAAVELVAARAGVAAASDAGLLACVNAVAAHVAIDGDRGVEAEALAERARVGAAATSQPDVECDALLVLGRLVRPSDWNRSQKYFEQAAGIAYAAGLGSWHLRARQELALAVWMHGEQQVLSETRELAARYGALGTVAMMDLTLADIALSTFDREGCFAAAAACVSASRRYHLATESVAHLWLAGAHALARDDDAMQGAIGDALAPDPDDPRILADLYGRVLATRALLADDLDALPSLLETMAEHVHRAPRGTSVYPGRILRALVHTVDRDPRAGESRSELETMAEQYGMRFFALTHEMVTAIALGADGDSVGATTRFGPAYAELLSVPIGVGPTYGYTVVFARAAIRDGWGDPARWLRAAEAFFVDRGYHRVARRCRMLLAEAGSPVPRRGRGDSEVPGSLRALGVTSREVDVLKLVAAGRTNKAIASELFLSPKTVERHLSSLFSRLGVANRRDLRARAAVYLGGGYA